MRLRGLIPTLFILACCSGVYAQQQTPAPLIQEEDAPAPALPAAPAPAGGLHEKAPPTEQQLREQQIRALDPMYRGDPAVVPADVVDENRESRQQQGTAPMRGSVAGSNRASVNPRRQEPEAPGNDSNSARVPEYAGPAVLSRSYTTNRPMVSQQLHWTPTFSVNSLYSGGLTGAAVKPGGKLENGSSLGTTFGWSLSGRHLWKHDQLGVSTTGSYNHYSSSAAYSGGNHNLNIDYTHEFSRRISVNVNEAASLYSQSQTLTNPALGIETSIANMNLSASPMVQILDAGFRQSSTSAALTFQKSARLSFSVGGGYFGVVRTGSGLMGNTGYSSSADVNYRYTRKTTVGLYYSFSDYVFSRHVQIANAHTTGAIYSYALSRSMQFRMRAGITRIESEGLISVAIDPVIARLLGQTSRIIDSYGRHITSDFSGELAKDFGRNRTAKLSYARGVSPGNGVQLTSIQEGLSGGFAMNLFRSYSADIGAGETRLTSAGQTMGKYDMRYYSVGLSHTYRGGLATNLSAYYRTFHITGTPVDHGQFSLSAGVSWSPGDNPLHLF